jgi:hypothetical protein
MNRTCSWAVLAAALVAPAAPAAGKDDRYAGADELARRIDRHLEEARDRAKVVPANAADDSEWLRRVYLDLAGRIPSVAEVRTFLADRRPDRRQKLVERLLAGGRYPTHFATVWRTLLVPEAGSNFQLRFGMEGFERWLRDWLVSDRGYDEMVKELLTVTFGGRRGGLAFGEGGPQTFYQAKEYKAEEVAAAASRLFLGVNLGCAQCHNHPFAQWKREQFWSFAAFFSGLQFQRQGDLAVLQTDRTDRHEIAIPGTEKVVKAKYLDGKEPEIKSGMKSREVLAAWMVARENPYFARAAVNRMWAHFFGTGLMEPLDEMAGTEAQASHPALLDELAGAFAERNYDVRWLIRALTATKAYQLSSRKSHPSQDDPRQFARAALRGLTPEQLFDSVAMATGFQESSRGNPYFGGNSARGEFLTKFANEADRPTERQTSILQALTLMNGRVMSSATNVKNSETLSAVADAPFLATAGKLEVLYLSALSRKPTAKELGRMTAYVEKAEQPAEALADVFWVLLNSGEFMLNH